MGLVKGALSRGKGVPPAMAPRASITGERCNELLSETIEDYDRACAVALLRAGGLDRLIHIATSVANDNGSATRRQ